MENTYFNHIQTFFCGFLAMIIGFSGIHDSSHHAIFSSNSRLKRLNYIISSLYMPVILGKHEMWSDHHIYKHHIDTGYPEYDPDTFCFKLYTKKTPKCSLHHLTRYFSIVINVFMHF